MTGTQKTLAIFGIAILVAAAMIPLAAHVAVLVVMWPVVPMTMLSVGFRVRQDPLPASVACRIPVQLRAPPTVSSAS